MQRVRAICFGERDVNPPPYPCVKPGSCSIALSAATRNRGPKDDPVLAESDRATGTYRIAEIKSGRYMVAIHQFDARHMDALQNKYDPVKTPVRVKVTDDGQVIDIDLPKELPH